MKIVHGTLRDFHRYWRDAPWAEPQFAAYMDAGKAEFWYARIGLRVVGRVYLFRELPDADAADGIKRAYLCNLHVLERYRGRGIGSALLNRMADRAKELGFLELSIGVEEENDANMRLISANGLSRSSKKCHGGFDLREECRWKLLCLWCISLDEERIIIWRKSR